MTIAQNEFDRWREVVRLAYEQAETAAQLIAGGEVQRGADRAQGAVEVLRELKVRMDLIGGVAETPLPDLEPAMGNGKP